MTYPLYSLESLLNYAKGRNPNEYYDYQNPSSCALSQYANDVGADYYTYHNCDMEWLAAGSHTMWADESVNGAPEYEFSRLTHRPLYAQPDWTWGKFAARLEAALIARRVAENA